MKKIFDTVSIKCSRVTTNAYSTSFSLGILCLGRELRDPIYAIYGFVRFADEIVDSFHSFNKKELLEHFVEDTYSSIEEGISLNPILNSFQHVVHKFGIERELIDCFLKSMAMDLSMHQHTAETFDTYIYGSAEAVGLMCLRVFSNRNNDMYTQLKPHARSLGAAFQKVNFLRDANADFNGMGRTYFPGIDLENFDESSKYKIQQDIERDFEHALTGIKMLPQASRFGVYVAYMYYRALFRKIKNTPPESVLQQRIRIPNRRKATLLAYSYIKHHLNMI